MVKKKFIDKKHAVTYSLVYRSTEDVDDVPERLLVEADKGVGPGRVDAEVAAAAAAREAASGRRYPPGHPLAWLEDEAAAAPMSEARRRELIELGFPDDGYDYLKHMRVLGRGQANLEGPPADAAAASSTAGEAGASHAAPGPSVFLPAPALEAPEEDVQVIDASRLTVMQAVEAEGDAAVMAGGVTAFSRARDRMRRGEQRELAELEEAMRALEEAEELGDAEGEGDLLDDFVLAATEMGLEPEHEGGGEDEEGGDESEYSMVESEDEEEGSSYAGSEGAPGSQAGSRAGRPPARAGSIASTYWREERHDRKNLLTVIDEKFEHLALEYDEEEIGDLEEQGETIRGFADVKEFDNLLDEFLEAHGQSQEAHEGNLPYSAPRISQVGKEMEFHGFDDADAGVAIQRAHEALRRAEEQAAAEEEAAAAGGDTQHRQERVPYYEPRERERWDCESVLSLRSNLDNHPGRISEPRGGNRRPRSTAGSSAALPGDGGIIRLGRMGIPMGVLPPRRGAGAAAEQQQQQQQQEEGAEEGASEGQAPVAAVAVPHERRKGETAEEKRARKAAVKDAKRSAREQKKELKGLFKEAAVAAQRLAATAQPQAALKLPS
ncbi:hypothetical protein ABPG75_011534 [Micractinium tetrahymenae]